MVVLVVEAELEGVLKGQMDWGCVLEKNLLLCEDLLVMLEARGVRLPARRGQICSGDREMQTAVLGRLCRRSNGGVCIIRRNLPVMRAGRLQAKAGATRSTPTEEGSNPEQLAK